MKNSTFLSVCALLLLSGCITPSDRSVDAVCGTDRDDQTADTYLDKVSLDILECRATNGDYMAQYNLGILYLEGKRVDQDYNKAANLFYQSGKTNSGEPGDSFIPGFGSQNYYGGPEERTRTTSGFAPAQYALGLMYLTGKGTKKNEERAEYWFKKAARLGSEEAKAVLKDIKEGA